MRHVRTIAAFALISLPSLPLLLAAPADAKPGHEPEPVAVATISGPGLEGPILLNGELVWRVLYLSTFRGVGLAAAEPPPADQLGPAFDAAYRFVQTNGDVQTLRQTLYPCAADGRTWAFTPAGQDDVRQGLRVSYLVQSGWWHSVRLASVVGAAELTAACRYAGNSARALSANPGSWAGPWTGLGAVALLTTIAALSRRSRRHRRPVRV